MTFWLHEISGRVPWAIRLARAQHHDAVGHAEHRLDQVLHHDDGDAHVADAPDEIHGGQDFGGIEPGK